jgi:hypothetical protein
MEDEEPLNSPSFELDHFAPCEFVELLEPSFFTFGKLSNNLLDSVQCHTRSDKLAFTPHPGFAGKGFCLSLRRVEGAAALQRLRQLTANAP